MQENFDIICKLWYFLFLNHLMIGVVRTWVNICTVYRIKLMSNTEQTFYE